MRLTWKVAAFTVFMAAIVTVGLVGATATRGPPGTLRVGSRVLTRCGSGLQTWCGSLSVPLDHSVPKSPRIRINYQWDPATEGAAVGTVVPNEGGPGYPTIRSVSGYAAMYGSLLEHRNLLAVDLRGTGTSALLNCPALQDFSGPTGGARFQSVLASCAAALNHRWWGADGKWIQASGLFTSAAAAEDMAAVIRALRIPKVDIYGDSYGAYYAQVFAARYPGLVRSVTLDSTSPVMDFDPWYRSGYGGMPQDFNNVCSRAVACAEAARGSSWSRIVSLAKRLRARQVSGVVPGPTGTDESVTMGVVGLVNLVNDAAQDDQIYKELDASARALLWDDDPAPLLRLYAQRLASDEQYFGIPADEYSGELYFAVVCLDYPQLFNMSAPESSRRAELAANEARLPNGTFSPFTTAEWLAQDEYTEAYTACVSWPSPQRAQPPIAQHQPFFPRTMPVLIIGGELDTWTSSLGIPQTMQEIGGQSRFINFINTTHEVGTTGCGAKIVREFVADPQALDRINATCANAEPPIHAAGVYPAPVSGVPKVRP